MSEALQALYAGDVRRGEELLPDDEQLAIFEAAAFGRHDALEAILRRDPGQVNAVSDDGFTPLHLAVFAKQRRTAELLIRHGADVDALASSTIARVRPLGTAAFVRSAELGRLLLDAGADPNGEGEGGFTPLHSAAQNGDGDFVRLLLERGADPTRATADGRRAADFADDGGVRELLRGSA